MASLLLNSSVGWAGNSSAPRSQRLGTLIMTQIHAKRFRISAAVAAMAAALLTLGQPASAGLVLHAPVDVLGHLAGTQFQTYGYGTLSYKDWGNEPSVTVNPPQSEPSGGVELFLWHELHALWRQFLLLYQWRDHVEFGILSSGPQQRDGRPGRLEVPL